jgi:1,4-alpha-glucan branching enzyme
MIKKSYSKSGHTCRVTFRLPAEVNAETAGLAAEFNDWNAEANPMNRLKDGSFSLSLSLPTGQSYRFRYLLDGERWENDWQADAYVPNVYGSEDSVVEL